jgi:hypothetical protein
MPFKTSLDIILAYACDVGVSRFLFELVDYFYKTRNENHNTGDFYQEGQRLF